MGLDFEFDPASEYGGWDPEVVAAIRALPRAQVQASRRVTIGDMELVLRALPDRLPTWSVEVEGAGESWTASLYRRSRGGAIQEMGMYAYDDDHRIAIQGCDEEVLDVLGQLLADRAGPQVLRLELSEEGQLFVPRPGAEVQPPPAVSDAPPPSPREPDHLARMFAPVGAMLDELDTRLRAHLIANLDDPHAARWVTVPEMTEALRQVARAHRGCKLTTRGTGARWRAVLARGADVIEMTVAGGRISIAGHDHDLLHALGRALAKRVGSQVLVVGDTASAVFVTTQNPIPSSGP